MRRAVQYALRKGVDVIVPSGNENQNLDDPKTDSISPTNGTSIQNRPVDLVSISGDRHAECQGFFLTTGVLCSR